MGPIKTTVLLKGGYMGFHVSLGECSALELRVKGLEWQLIHAHILSTLNPKPLNLMLLHSRIRGLT